jgi:hypothetical protein
MLHGINGFPGSNRMSGPSSSFPRNTGKFDAKTLMRSPALRRTILSWHITGGKAPEILKKTIETDLPELAGIKNETCSMSAEKIMIEADKLVRDLWERISTVPEIAENFPALPSFAEFALKNIPNFNPRQLYSNFLGGCSEIFDAKDSNAPIDNADLISYRNTWIITIALLLISDKFDFISQIKGYLMENFPQLEKVTGLDDLLSRLDDELIIKIALLLARIDKTMGIPFNRVLIDETASVQNAAFVNKDSKTVTIFTRFVSRLQFPVPIEVRKPEYEQLFEAIDKFIQIGLKSGSAI